MDQAQTDIRKSILPISISTIYKKPEKDDSVKVLKDVNYLESNDLFLQFNQNDREDLFEQIKKDTDFFTKLNIMDYSLLLAVNDDFPLLKQRFTRTDSERSICLRSRKIQCGDKIASISIIDILQQYDVWKRLEFRYKAFFGQNDPNLLSCVDSEIYRQRFVGFMNSIMISVINY